MRLQPHISMIHTHLCTLGRILDWFKHANLIIKIASINASGISLDQSEVEPGSVERLRAVNHRSFIRVAIEMLLGVVSGLRDRIAGAKKMFCLLVILTRRGKKIHEAIHLTDTDPRRACDSTWACTPKWVANAKPSIARTTQERCMLEFEKWHTRKCQNIKLKEYILARLSFLLDPPKITRTDRHHDCPSQYQHHDPILWRMRVRAPFEGTEGLPR